MTSLCSNANSSLPSLVLFFIAFRDARYDGDACPDDEEDEEETAAVAPRALSTEAGIKDVSRL